MTAFKQATFRVAYLSNNTKWKLQIAQKDDEKGGMLCDKNIPWWWVVCTNIDHSLSFIRAEKYKCDTDNRRRKKSQELVW